MPVYDLYSKRQKRLRGEMPDVLSYDEIPPALKEQIIYIFDDCLSDYRYNNDKYGHYELVVKILSREYGLPALYNGRSDGHRDELIRFFRSAATDQSLDVIEATMPLIEYTRDFSYRMSPLPPIDYREIVANAIEELNHRFKEHGVGYQYIDKKIIRIDSELVHAEVVKPALALLRDPRYAGAQQEFLKAHGHYRAGNHKEAMVEGLKALESLMIAICDRRGWSHPENATARNLIDTCFKNELIPKFWQSHFTSLQQLLCETIARHLLR